MNVVDSSGWLEYFAGDDGAEVWTQDADFEGLAGVRYRRKPAA